jgi:hypothetical protein
VGTGAGGQELFFGPVLQFRQLRGLPQQRIAIEFLRLQLEAQFQPARPKLFIQFGHFGEELLVGFQRGR